MNRISAGLIIMVAALMVSSQISYAGTVASVTSNYTHTPVPCDADAHICGDWQYAGTPSYVFTGRVGRAVDIVRLGADHEVAYVGVNARWNLSTQTNSPRFGATSNSLLACRARTGACEVVQVSDSAQVTRVLGADGANLLAMIETYRADSLNTFDASYAKSADNGKMWSPVPVPEDCRSELSCGLVMLSSNEYSLLATDSSAESFDAWTTNVYRTTDRGQTWVKQNSAALPSMLWSSATTRSGVDLVLGPRHRQTKIVRISNGHEDVVLSDVSQLPGEVVRMSRSGDVLYALVAIGGYPTKETRLYAIRDNAATELWRNTNVVGHIWANDQAIVVESADRQDMVWSAEEFRRTLHVSPDRGKTWRFIVLPDELTNSLVDVAGNRVWVVTQKGVWYRDVV